MNNNNNLRERMIQFGKKYPATKYLVIVALVMVVFLRTLRKKAIELKNIKLWDAAPMITYEVSLDYDHPFKELGIDVDEEYNMNLENIRMARDLGFGGVVVCGDLWNRFNIHNETDYKELVAHFERLRKAVG